jgi:hypothetical protein
MDNATYNKKQMKTLVGYELADVIVRDGVMRLVFTNGTKATGVDILCDPEGNGPGYAEVRHV